MTEAAAELSGLGTEAEQERRTGYLELFFDLVFVFAITQVTALIFANPSTAGFARATLVLWLVWWAWGGYAWMTNAISIDSRGVRLTFLCVTLGCFFVALGVPLAYKDEALWFAIPYVAVRTAHVALYVWGLRREPEHQSAIRMLAPWFLVAPLFVLVGGFLDGDARVVMWLLAVAVDVAGALRVSNAGFRVSAAHFAERYSLFVIIALGESIVAIGSGASFTAHDWLYAVAVTVAFGGVAVLWWAYFDFLFLGAERSLARRPIDRRGPLARDLYSFIHFAFVLGIVFYAVAAKKTLEHPNEPLTTAGRWALGVGFAVYLFGSVVGRLRAIGSFAWERAAGTAAALLAVAVFRDLDAVWLVAVVAGLVAGAILAESVRLRELRRSLVAHEP